MKQVLAIFAVAFSLAACGPTGAGPEEAQAQISFDGADYQTEEEKLAHGERIATVLGCNGCHGRDLEGGAFAEEFIPGIYSSNLTYVVQKFDDKQLDQIIRQGIHPERGEVWMMPSEAFHHLSDRDFDAIVTFLRSFPQSGEDQPATNIPAEIQEELRRDEIGPATLRLQVALENQALDVGEEHELGRHFAIMVCGECHGSDLTGFETFSPDLMIAGAYEPEQLQQLLTTGAALGGRDIGLMGEMGEYRFSQLTERERNSIIGYLLARAQAMPPE